MLEIILTILKYWSIIGPIVVIIYLLFTSTDPAKFEPLSGQLYMLIIAGPAIWLIYIIFFIYEYFKYR